MIEKFLILCSGANRDILRESRIETPKFIGIGATILLTAILASISAGYAIFFVFNNLFLSLILSILWGFTTFYLDRFIVSSIKKSNTWSADFLAALPRILIAIILSITISKPLELKLFDKAVAIKVKEIQIGANGGNSVNEVKLDDDFFLRLQALNELKKTENTVWWASILITLLFILNTTSPIIVKLLSRKGPYDEILNRIEYEIYLEQKKIISNKNDEINYALKETNEINKFKSDLRIKAEKSKLESELETKETIINKLTQKQEDLTKISIEKWYADELETELAIINIKNKKSIKCFISSSSKDLHYVSKLKSFLESREIEVISSINFTTGDALTTQIQNIISEVDFVIVLIPSEDHSKGQVRENIIFELGLSLGANKSVITLVESSPKNQFPANLPSALQGIMYLRYEPERIESSFHYIDNWTKNLLEINSNA